MERSRGYHLRIKERASLVWWEKVVIVLMFVATTLTMFWLISRKG